MAPPSRITVVAAVVWLTIMPSAGWAQSASPLHHLELSGGFGFATGAKVGDQNADLRTSTPGTPYRLFNSSTRIGSAPMIDVRAGIALTRRFGVEAHASYGHPDLRTSVSSDAEGAPSLTAVERLDEYVIDGGVVVRFDEWTVGGWTPFATGGAGYLRQLHEDLTATEEGHVVFVGGGVKRGLVARPGGWLRGVGARADARLDLLSGGITIDDKARSHVAISGSLFITF